MKRLTQKTIDRMVEAAFYRVAQGVQIPIMELGTISRAGRNAIMAGQDLDAAIRTAVAPYRQS